MNETVAIPSPLQATTQFDPVEVADDQPIQYDLFTGAPITEIRVALASVRNLPVPNSTRFKPDQAVRGTIVGNIKGVTQLRGVSGQYVNTYLVEVVEATLDGI
jgi:hypothetical protein